MINAALSFLTFYDRVSTIDFENVYNNIEVMQQRYFKSNCQLRDLNYCQLRKFAMEY